MNPRPFNKHLEIVHLSGFRFQEHKKGPAKAADVDADDIIAGIEAQADAANKAAQDKAAAAAQQVAKKPGRPKGPFEPSGFAVEPKGVYCGVDYDRSGNPIFIKRLKDPNTKLKALVNTHLMILNLIRLIFS